MLEPLRRFLLLKAGWVCTVGTHVNEVFEMLRIARVPCVPSLHFFTLSKAVYPACYSLRMPRSYLSISSEKCSSKAHGLEKIALMCGNN